MLSTTLTIAVTDIQQAEANYQTVMLALIAVGATLVGTLTVAIKGLQQSKAVNRAVNDVDKDEPRIYDNVAMILLKMERLEVAQEAYERKGWAHGLPEDLDTAPRLTETIRGLQRADNRIFEEHAEIMEKIEALEQSLKKHKEES